MSLPVSIEHPLHGKGQQTSILSQGLRKVHTSFQSGSEMIEEFNLGTNTLLSRRVRHVTGLGALGSWTVEVGEQMPVFDRSKDFIGVASSNPVFSRHDSPTHFLFRVRPIPYPAATYLVTVDHDTQQLVIATVNRKYYKRIDIPEMTVLARTHAQSKLKTKYEESKVSMNIDGHSDANDGRLRESDLNWHWANGTLSLEYRKPPAIREAESRLLAKIAQQ